MKDREEMLILYLEDLLEPHEKEELEKQLAGDAELREELDDLCRAMQLVSERTPEEPGEAYWNSFYSRLQPKLEKKSLFNQFRGWFEMGSRFKPVAAVGAFASLFIVAGIMLVQLVSPGEPGPDVRYTTVKVKRTEGYLQYVAAQHLERSRLLLQEMVNISDDDDDILLKIRNNKEQGERLLSDNRAFRLAAARADDDTLEELLDELELLLLDIANLDTDTIQYALPSLQRRIVKKNLLIKIEIINLADENAGPTTPDPEV